MAKKTKKSEPTKAPKRRRLFWWYIGAVELTALLLLGTIVYAKYYQNRIVPHTIIGGISAGGLTTAQAEKLLTDKVIKFDNTNLKLNYQDKTWQLRPADIGLTLEIDQAIGSAYQTGRSGSALRNFASKVKALFVVHKFPVTAVSLSAAGLTKLQETLKSIEVSTAETTLNFTPGHVTIVPGKGGSHLDLIKFTGDLSAVFASGATTIDLALISINPTVTAANAESARTQAEQILSASWTLKVAGQNFTLNPATVATFLTAQAVNSNLNLTIDQTKLNAYLTTLAAKIALAPVNATLAVEDGAVSVNKDGTNGIGLDIAQTAAAVSSALLAANPASRVITGVDQVLTPAVWSGNLSSLGLNQLIGTGTTDFSGSPANRVANIQTGTSRINGQLVQPGAEFSTVGVLSPIDQAHGYVPGLVIVNNQTFPADGGGLCQVSTTLFRAVLNTGLPITARTPHSYEVSYYQRGVGPGLDATIYDPNPDFKWINDTGHIIYIQGFIKGKTLTFNLFGTSDGRTAAITGPTVLSTSQPSGPPIYVSTDTMATGTIRQIDPPVPGGKTTATYTVSRNGAVINKQVFTSSYTAMPAQYLIGTGTPVPPDTCSNGVQDGDETGVDCGGSCLTTCPATQ